MIEKKVLENESTATSRIKFTNGVRSNMLKNPSLPN